VADALGGAATEIAGGELDLTTVDGRRLELGAFARRERGA
jgi:hypothetical protein